VISLPSQVPFRVNPDTGLIVCPTILPKSYPEKCSGAHRVEVLVQNWLIEKNKTNKQKMKPVLRMLGNFTHYSRFLVS
jgi:hypothetical protein